MNKTQLKNWKKLSLGLARNSYKNITPERREKLLLAIEDFIEALIYDYELSEIADWDGNQGSVHICDELSNYMWNRGYEFERTRKGWCEIQTGRFGTMLAACIRAGFDVAVSPSAGVVGFTVGDLRAVFGRRIPKWVTDFFDPPLPTDAPSSDGVWL